MRILIDMNRSPHWVSRLESADHVASHWSSEGDPGAADEVLMQWARDNEAVIFTHDLDFGTLLALTNANGPSVIQVRAQDVLPDAISQLVLTALEQFENELATGVLLTIERSTSRARLLPIKPIDP